MPEEPCNCNVCRIIREAFQIQPGNEVEHLNKLVESLKEHALQLNEIAQIIDKDKMNLNKKQIHINNVLTESIKHTNNAIKLVDNRLIKAENEE